MLRKHLKSHVVKTKKKIECSTLSESTLFYNFYVLPLTKGRIQCKGNCRKCITVHKRKNLNSRYDFEISSKVMRMNLSYVELLFLVVRRVNLMVMLCNDALEQWKYDVVSYKYAWACNHSGQTLKSDILLSWPAKLTQLLTSLHFGLLPHGG